MRIDAKRKYDPLLICFPHPVLTYLEELGLEVEACKVGFAVYHSAQEQWKWFVSER